MRQMVPIGGHSDALVAIGDTLASSATILIDGREALLIDALGSADDTSWLCRRLDERGLKVRQIIVTHYFSDHMAALHRFPDAEIIAHRDFRATFACETNRTAEEAAFFVAPTIHLEDELTLKWGRFSLRLFHNPGYTPDMINIDIPELDAVHAGDTVVHDMVFLHYADHGRLHAALDRLEALGRHHLLLSHGGPRSAASIANARHYLRAIEAGELDLARCLAAGIDPTADMRDYHARNVAVARMRKIT